MPVPICLTSPARTISLCEIASASAGACFSVGSRYSVSLVIAWDGILRVLQLLRVLREAKAG